MSWRRPNIIKSLPMSITKPISQRSEPIHNRQTSPEYLLKYLF